MNPIIPVINDREPSLIETAAGIPIAAVVGAGTGALALVQITGNWLARLAGDEASVIQDIASTSRTLGEFDSYVGTRFREVYENNQTLSDVASVLIPGVGVGVATAKANVGVRAIEKLAEGSAKFGKVLETRANLPGAQRIFGLPENYTQKAIAERQAAKLLSGDYEGLGRLVSKDRIAYALNSAGAWTAEVALAELGTIALQLNNPIYDDIEDFGDALRVSLGTGLIFGGLAGGLRYALGLKNVNYAANESLGTLKAQGLANFEFLTSDGAIGELARFSQERGALFAKNAEFYLKPEADIIKDLKGLERRWAKNLPANLQAEWESGLAARAKQIKNYYDTNFQSIVSQFATPEAAERVITALKRGDIGNGEIFAGVKSISLPSLDANAWTFLQQADTIEEKTKILEKLVQRKNLDETLLADLQQVVTKKNAAEIFSRLVAQKTLDFDEFTRLHRDVLGISQKRAMNLYAFAKQVPGWKNVDVAEFFTVRRPVYIKLTPNGNKLVANPHDLTLGDFVRTEAKPVRKTSGVEVITDLTREKINKQLDAVANGGIFEVDEFKLKVPKVLDNTDLLTSFNPEDSMYPVTVQIGWEVAKRNPVPLKPDTPIESIVNPFLAYAHLLQDPGNAALKSHFANLQAKMRTTLKELGLNDEQIKFLSTPETDFIQGNYVQARLTDTPPYAKLDQFAAHAVSAIANADRAAAVIAKSQAFTAAQQLGISSQIEAYAEMLETARKTLGLDALNETGQGILSNATARANSLQAALQLSGQFVNKVSQEVQKNFWEKFLPAYTSAVRNMKPDELIELNLVHQKIMSTPLGWQKMTPDLANQLVATGRLTNPNDYHYVHEDFLKSFDRGLLMQITNPQVRDFWDTIYDLSNTFASSVKALNGKLDGKPSPIYFPQIRSSQRPWVAMIDEFGSETIGTPGFRQMIHARTEDELARRVSAIVEALPLRSAQITVNSQTVATQLKPKAMSLGEITVDKQLKGVYDVKEAFSEFQVDSTLKRSGRYGEYDPRVGTEVVEEYLEWMLNSAKNLVRDVAKQSQIELFGQLETRSFALQPYAQSQKGKFYKENIDGFGDNIYSRAMRLALDYKPNERYEWISRWQSASARVTNLALSRLSSMAERGYQNLSDTDLAAISNTYTTYAKRLGLDSSKFTAEYLKTLPTGLRTGKYLESASHALNAFQATFHLGLDWFNALANTLSAPFIFSSAVRQFSADLKFNPTIGDIGIFTAKTLKEFFSNLQYMKADGLDPRAPQYLKELFDWGILNDGHRMILQDIEKSLKIPQAVSNGLGTKLKEYAGAAMRIAQEPTAKTELFGAYIAARFGQIAGQKLGFDKSAQLVFANTLRQYSTGGLIASQRPILFSGWLGNTFGLYKSFMLNVYQNSLQHVADGRMRDFLALAGLQTLTFGLRGTPVSTLADEILFQHYRDDYEGINTAVPMNGMLYGLGSWITQSNIFTRGDLTLNPEFLNPLNPQAYAGLHATLKTIGVVTDALKGDMSVAGAFNEILLRQQVSRPLQRLTELSAGVRYDKNGNPITFLDNWTAWSIALRAMGGAPLDEAVMIDSYYRFSDKLWRNDLARRELSAATRKMLLLDPENVDWDDVVRNYIRYGGDPDNFSNWVKRLATASNEDAAIRMAKKLKNVPAIDYWFSISP